jgi:hypothetical protein
VHRLGGLYPARTSRTGPSQRAAPAGTEPVPPERNGTVMNHSHATEQQRRAEELISWTRGERIRFLWYRLCLTVQEIIIANGQMIELEMGLTPPDSAPPAARCQESGECGLAATTRAHAELRALSWRISMHGLEYSLTLSRSRGRWPWGLFSWAGRKSDRRFRVDCLLARR